MVPIVSTGCRLGNMIINHFYLLMMQLCLLLLPRISSNY